MSSTRRSRRRDADSEGEATPRAHELRLIGRVLRIKAYEHLWEGMLSLVTRNTIVMQDVQKMTIDQFERRQAAKSTSAQQQATARQGGLAGSETPQPDSGTPDAAPPQPAAATSTEPFAEDSSGQDGRAILEYLPNVTFTRKMLSKVEFADDTPSAGGGAIGVAGVMEDGGPNDERLRVFVRRYIIHTSQGNNPSSISMTEFLRTRLRWAHPNEERIKRVAEEETNDLVSIEQEIITHRERSRSHSARGGTGLRGAGGAVAVGRRHGAREGLLYELGLPSKTSYIGVLHLALSITLLLYSANAFSSTERNIVSKFLGHLASWAAIGAASELLAGGGSGYHAMKMKLPLNYRPLAVRIVLWLVACVGIISTSIVLSRAGFNYVNIKEQSIKEYYQSVVKNDPLSVCQYGVTNRCSGWTVGCKTEWDNIFCTAQCSSQAGFVNGCEAGLKKAIKSCLMPMIIMSYVSVGALCVDAYLLYRTMTEGNVFETRTTV